MAIEIRTFDSSIEDLYAMMDRAWAADYSKEPRFDYSPAFLRWHLQAPETDPELLVAAYDGSRVVGFGASFPRTFAMRGRNAPVAGALSTFFTVDADYRRQRVGWRLVEERLRRQREYGLAMSLVYLQPGHASFPLYERLGRETRARVQRVARCPYRVRLLDPSRVSERSRSAWGSAMVDLPRDHDGSGTGVVVRPMEAADLSRCLELLNAKVTVCSLGRVFGDAEELVWQIAHAPESEALVAEVGGVVEGLLSWFQIDQLAKTREPIAQVDHVAFGTLDRPRQSALVGEALRRMAHRGCMTALLNSPRHYDEAAFEELGFVTFPAHLELYAVVFDRELELTDLEDVCFEQR